MTVGSLFDGEAVREWLQTVHGVTPGLIHISSSGNWTGQTFLTVDEASVYVETLETSKPEGIYSRVTTLAAIPESGKRGSAKASKALSYLWADLDLAGPGHAESNLPPGENAGRGIVARSGLPEPSVWIHSGGGLYPIWLLDEPHVVEDEEDFADLAQLLDGWDDILEHATSQGGWHFGTGVNDLARILRIPGTVNRKAGLERPCRMLGTVGKRYSLDELYQGFVDGLATLPPPPTARQPSLPRSGHFRAGDDYSEKADWADILLPAGWTFGYARGDVRHWIRPGKRHGISATTNALGSDKLHVFSSSAPPFEAGESYSKFGAYTELSHGGDYTAAAKALTDGGYGPGGVSDATPGDVYADVPVVTAAVPATPADGETAEEGKPARLFLTPLSSIPPKRTKWLWHDRIPLGELTLVAGREGVGKSTYLADLAAKITTGKAEGEYGEPRGVLYVAQEDSWSHTIVPRMKVAGADLNAVYRVEAVEDQGITLPIHCNELADMARSVNASAIMLDPVISLIDSNLSTDKARELRRALEPLARAAESAGCAVIGLVHFNKASVDDILTMISGSRGWVEVARAAIVLVRDKDNGHCVLSQAKNNLGRMDLASHSYRIIESSFTHGGEHIVSSRVEWLGKVEQTAEDLLFTKKSSSGGEKVGRPKKIADSAIYDYILDEHGKTGAPIKKSSIVHYFVELLHVSEPTIESELAAMVQDKLLTRPARGFYLPNTG